MAEIAAVLGVSDGAVKVRHLRALKRLHAALQGDEENPGRATAHERTPAESRPVASVDLDPALADLNRPAHPRAFQAGDVIDLQACLCEYPPVRRSTAGAGAGGAWRCGRRPDPRAAVSRHWRPHRYRPRPGGSASICCCREIGRGGMGVVYEAVQENAGPPRGPQGAAAHGRGPPGPAGTVSTRGEGGGPACTTPTSCPSSASAPTATSISTRCSSSPAAAWTTVLRERRDRREQPRAGARCPQRAGPPPH